MILETVRAALAELLGDNIPVFWNTAADIDGLDFEEYVIYIQDANPTGFVTDNCVLVRNPAISVRYYYRSTLGAKTYGRAQVALRARLILEAVEAAGLETTTGEMWLGDVDGIGFDCVAMEFDGMEVM